MSMTLINASSMTQLQQACNTEHSGEAGGKREAGISFGLSIDWMEKTASNPRHFLTNNCSHDEFWPEAMLLGMWVSRQV